MLIILSNHKRDLIPEKLQINVISSIYTFSMTPPFKETRSCTCTDFKQKCLENISHI